jgi:excisionase family DNA binding protein
LGKSKAGDLMTSGQAARVLGVSAERVRQLENAGQIEAMRTASGLRLFSAVAVEALRRRRQESDDGRFKPRPRRVR